MKKKTNPLVKADWLKKLIIILCLEIIQIMKTKNLRN